MNTPNTMKTATNINRYLKIARYLHHRYTINGAIAAQHGHFMSLPAALDYAAARRYLGC